MQIDLNSVVVIWSIEVETGVGVVSVGGSFCKGAQKQVGIGEGHYHMHHLMWEKNPEVGWQPWMCSSHSTPLSPVPLFASPRLERIIKKEQYTQL